MGMLFTQEKARGIRTHAAKTSQKPSKNHIS
jgi:hypothetical protein